MSTMTCMQVLGWKEQHLSELRCAAFALVRQGHYQKAVLYFEGIIALLPIAYDYQTLGALYLQLNANDKALSCLDTALRLEPTHAPSLLNKTKAMLMLGQVQPALEHARVLQRHSDPMIADDATALILGYA